jgi:hypothetical protein
MENKKGVDRMMDRFMEKVSPEPNSGCWLWTATGNKEGYGYFGISHSHHQKAHRVAYELFRGPIPKGFLVCHKCDVPCCVNPNHLFLGTYQDNMDDRAAKGRTALGTQNGKARLSPELVRKIRASDLSERAIARELGVHRGTVNAVLSGRTWGHVG